MIFTLNIFDKRDELTLHGVVKWEKLPSLTPTMLSLFGRQLIILGL